MRTKFKIKNSEEHLCRCYLNHHKYHMDSPGNEPGLPRWQSEPGEYRPERRDTSAKCFGKLFEVIQQIEGRVRNCCVLHAAWGYLSLISPEVKRPQCRTDYKILYNAEALISWITFSQLGAFAQRVKKCVCVCVCVWERERERERAISESDVWRLWICHSFAQNVIITVGARLSCTKPYTWNLSTIAATWFMR